MPCHAREIPGTLPTAVDLINDMSFTFYTVVDLINDMSFTFYTAMDSQLKFIIHNDFVATESGTDSILEGKATKRGFTSVSRLNPFFLATIVQNLTSVFPTANLRLPEWNPFRTGQRRTLFPCSTPLYHNFKPREV
jgi:hypothetical protein